MDLFCKELANLKSSKTRVVRRKLADWYIDACTNIFEAIERNLTGHHDGIYLATMIPGSEVNVKIFGEVIASDIVENLDWDMKYIEKQVLAITSFGNELPFGNHNLIGSCVNGKLADLESLDTKRDRYFFSKYYALDEDSLSQLSVNYLLKDIFLIALCEDAFGDIFRVKLSIKIASQFND